MTVDKQIGEWSQIDYKNKYKSVHLIGCRQISSQSNSNLLGGNVYGG